MISATQVQHSAWSRCAHYTIPASSTRARTTTSSTTPYRRAVVNTLIGGFYHAENTLAKIYINYQHACSLVPVCTAALQFAMHAACMARLLCALERECARMRRVEKRLPTLAEQRAFFA